MCLSLCLTANLNFHYFLFFQRSKDNKNIETYLDRNKLGILILGEFLDMTGLEFGKL